MKHKVRYCKNRGSEHNTIMKKSSCKATFHHIHAKNFQLTWLRNAFLASKARPKGNLGASRQPKRGGRNSEERTGERPDPVGRGRGGVTPPLGLGIGFDSMIEFGKKDCGLDLIG